MLCQPTPLENETDPLADHAICSIGREIRNPHGFSVEIFAGLLR
jgi:hypothetical protein